MTANPLCNTIFTMAEDTTTKGETMTQEEIRQNALDRAENGQSLVNYGIILSGFVAKGIPEDMINPRENVFTYSAWQAKGRQVMRGEKGVKIVTRKPCEKKTGDIDPKTGEEKIDRFSIPWTATVFHITQTEQIDPNKKKRTRKKKGTRKARKPTTSTPRDLIQEPVALSMIAEETTDGRREQQEADDRAEAESKQGLLF